MMGIQEILDRVDLGRSELTDAMYLYIGRQKKGLAKDTYLASHKREITEEIIAFVKANKDLFKEALK